MEMKEYELTEEEQKLLDQLDLEEYLDGLEELRLLNHKGLRSLSMEELVRYRKIEREMDLLTDRVAKYDFLRKLFHPILIGAFHLYHKMNHIKIRAYGSIPKTNRPIIFCPTHIGMYDVEILLQVLGTKHHAYLFSADEEAMYRTFDGLIFNLNGVKYVDPEDKYDRKIGYATNVELLRQGKNVYWNAEGTWNLTESTVVLPLHKSIIEAALATNAVILPMAIEQLDGEKGHTFLVNIGSFLDPSAIIKDSTSQEEIIDLTDFLRSEMAALKIQLWPRSSRKYIPDTEYEDYLNKRIAEWPFYSTDIIRDRIFNPHGYVNESEVMEPISSLEIGKHNAFLARVRENYKKYHEKDVW